MAHQAVKQRFDTEAEYRKQIQSALEAVERALADADPDLVECEQSLGVLTLTLADRSKCILSAQPSVQQLWLAMASLGTAVHFDFDFARGAWIDDKGRGIELLTYLESFLKEKTGTLWQIQPTLAK